MTLDTTDATKLTFALALGLVGVVIFGLTLPATRIAVMELDPIFVTTGRSLLAAACAGAALFVWRAKLPPRDTLLPLFLFGLVCVLGYPLLAGFAMQNAPSSHGGVVLAVQPLLTAMAGIWVAGERPSIGFWACSVAGTVAAVTYAVLAGAGSTAVHWADLLLAGAAISGSIGYAIGGHLTHRMAGWEVISWALVLMAPVMALILLISGARIGAHTGGTVSPRGWAAFVYLGLFSMYLGFFAWNRALAIGGIAKVGQIQLLQPFVTLSAAALLLGERIGWLEIAFSALVVALVAVGSRMRVARRL